MRLASLSDLLFPRACNENYNQLIFWLLGFPHISTYAVNIVHFTRAGMTQIFPVLAASSQTFGTILIALRTGSQMEACFATRPWVLSW
jgi:hypothetical protein